MLIALFFVSLPAKNAEGSLFVEVHGPYNGERRYRATYPLAEDREFSIMGREGELHAKIEGSSVFVVSSPCKNKVCVLSPPLSKEGEWIACVPGEVIIRIASSGQREGRKGPDALSY